MKTIITFLKLFWSVNINKAKIILKDIDPLKKKKHTPYDNRVKNNLSTQIRRKQAISFPKYFRYKTYEILTQDLDKHTLKNQLYELIFFLLYWIERLEEVEDDK